MVHGSGNGTRDTRDVVIPTVQVYFVKRVPAETS